MPATFTTTGNASLLTSPSAGLAARQDTQPELAKLIRLPFASLGLVMPAPGALTPVAVTEAKTGVVFLGEFCYYEGEKACPIITGAGVRSKKLMGVKNIDVYALGLYVKEQDARRELSGRFSGEPPARLAHDQTLFDELVKRDSIEKSLRIVITSGLVKRKNFLEALNERLQPPLEQSHQLAALAQFQRQFDNAPFHKGMEISFTWAGGKLITKIDGKQVGTLDNKALSHALLDIYVGRDPASKDAKESFGRGLAAMLHR